MVSLKLGKYLWVAEGSEACQIKITGRGVSGCEEKGRGANHGDAAVYKPRHKLSEAVPTVWVRKH